MNININIKRRYKINGKEYDSIENVPEDMRDIFKKAIDLQTGTTSQINPAAIKTKIVFNGKEYESIDAMPPDDRDLYEKVLEAAATGTAPPEIATTAITSSVPTQSKTSATGHMGASSKPSKIEPSSSRKLIIVIALGALMLLLYYLMQGK
jgi:septal ring-binding cell division protein DamX